MLALPLLNACASPSHARDADDLRAALADLPGVTSVELDYTEPVVLDSGKLELRVAMSNEAEPEAVVEVARRAYEGFTGPHQGEEGDLFVDIADDTLHLRSFDPDADVDAVEKAARHAVAVFPDAVVSTDINTQDVEKSPHVFTRYDVTIGEQDAESVLRTLTELEQAHGDIPDARWSVQTATDDTGWSLGSGSGFPSSQERALFNQLRQDIPRGASIFLNDDVAAARVPAGSTPDEVSAMARDHLAQLGGVKKSFYDVTSGENFFLMNTLGDCTFASAPVGARLEQDLGSECAKVTRVTE